MKKPWTYRLKKLNYSYGWRRWYRLLSRDRTPPESVEVRLTWGLRTYFYKWNNSTQRYEPMKKAQVTVGWDASISNDVELYEVVVKLGGDQIATDSLPFTVTEFVVPQLFDEGDLVTAKVTVVDFAGNRSEATVDTITIPDFTAPAAVESLTFSVDIIDVPDEV